MNGTSRSGVALGQIIRLEIQYSDQSGNYVDPSTYPTITIVDSSNKVVLNDDRHRHPDNVRRDRDDWDDRDYRDDYDRGHNKYDFERDRPRDSGVRRRDVGLYYYDYTIPMNCNTLGVWQDIWSVHVNGVPFTKMLNFTVNTQTSAVTAEAGQEIDPELSQEAAKNVFMLMKLLRTRLGSDGVRRKRDQFGRFITGLNGEYVMEPCDVFTTEELYTFLKASLAEFNSIPHFTGFTFNEPPFVKTFQHELTEGAFIMALALQGLREKGREFTMTDDGVSYNAPQIADYIKGYLSDFMASYRERIKFIKCSMLPRPMGFGTVYSLAGAGVSPAYLRLRHLRERQII
jgi:hypothetical protein